MQGCNSVNSFTFFGITNCRRAIRREGAMKLHGAGLRPSQPEKFAQNARTKEVTTWVYHHKIIIGTMYVRAVM